MISHIEVLLPQPSTLMFMERLEEREAVIRSFTVPQIRSAVSLSLILSYSLILSLSQTHKHTYLSVPYLLPPRSPPPFHPHSGSSCHHLSSSATPQKPIQTCSKPSWHVGQGRWSPFRFSATASLLPSSLVAAPSLLLNISSTRLMYQQGS